jgi:hypothetical protein
MDDDTQSLKQTARLAGVFWLLNVLTTAFSLGYVRSNLITLSDAVATTNNIQANEPLFRMGIASYLFSQVCLFFFGLMLYRLFKEVNKTWSIVVLTSVLITVAIAVVNQLNNIAALVVLGKSDFLNAFGQEQLNAFTMIFMRLNNHGQALLEIFWGPFFFSLGLLIIKSRLVPKIFGFLLIIGSLGFPIYSFTRLLVPQFPSAIIIQITQFIMALASIPTIFWFLTKGVKEQSPIVEI